MFSDEDAAHDYIVQMRWPAGVCCPRCGSTAVTYIKTRKLWKCKDCVERKQFSVRVGTIFEDSKLKLGHWLVAIWQLVNCKNGISSYELARALGITQKSAWFMLHRARLALHVGSFDRKLIGHIEVDETYIGGRARYMHKDKVARLKAEPIMGKAVVMGLLDRHNGEIRAFVVPSAHKRHLVGKIYENVEPGALILSDENQTYNMLYRHYAHEVINHAECYAKGHVHTNGLENFWSLTKRAIKGTYVAVEPFHLFRYMDEQTFRFNNRKTDDAERFHKAVRGCNRKRLTYNSLTGKDAEGSTPSVSAEGSVDEGEAE